MQVELLEMDTHPEDPSKPGAGPYGIERRVLPDRRVTPADNALYASRRKVIRRRADRELVRFLDGQGAQAGDVEYVSGCQVEED